VSYDTTDAVVTVNGASGKVSGLHAGHIVSIQGTEPETKNGRIKADRITLVSEVRGAISRVDAQARTVTVLGQVVRVPDGVAGLVTGALVRISGFPDSAGVFTASSIDVESAQAVAQIKGVVRSVDATRSTFTIADLTVDYASAGVQGAIGVGSTVIVQGQSSGSALVASSVEVYRGVGTPGDKGDIEGVITAYASDQDFDVNGQPVLADSNTQYKIKGEALALDARVTVKGRFDGNGVLIADKIQTDNPNKK
jgi:hypothetical protein